MYREEYTCLCDEVGQEDKVVMLPTTKFIVERQVNNNVYAGSDTSGRQRPRSHSILQLLSKHVLRIAFSAVDLGFSP